MRTEADTPLEQRFLMIVGKLSHGIIRQLEEHEIPHQLERARQRGNDRMLAPWESFSKRDRTQDQAFYTLYSYADIPLGRQYDCIFDKDTGHAEQVACQIDHAIFEGWIPTDRVEHGHKHIVFLRFDGSLPDYIPTIERREDIGRADWQFGLCDRTTYDAIHETEESDGNTQIR